MSCLTCRCPDMSGFEVQEQLARDEPGLPLIFITAHNGEEHRGPRGQRRGRGLCCTNHSPTGRCWNCFRWPCSRGPARTSEDTRESRYAEAGHGPVVLHVSDLRLAS